MFLKQRARASSRRALIGLFACATIIACGARTGLRRGTASESSGGDAGADSSKPPQTCVVTADCIPDDRCSTLRCVEGECVAGPPVQCSDGDECTEDTCNPDTGACHFRQLALDLDGDGFKGPRPGFPPGTPGACGDDCDDRSPLAHPGVAEVCDGVDNDCNGIVDDGAEYRVASDPPRRIASDQLERSARSGIAFDGKQFGITYSGQTTRWRSFFQAIDATGVTIVPETMISNINAESYAGNLVYNGSYFGTAWQDARQDGNYEVYFNRLASDASRLGPDVRLSVGEGFSLNPQLVWTGADFLVVWDDRRFDKPGPDDVRLFGQRVDLDAQPVGENVQLTPSWMNAEYPSIALGGSRLGIVFASQDDSGIHARFMTTQVDLSGATQPIDVGSKDVRNPGIVSVGGRFVVAWEEYAAGPGKSIWGAVLSEDGAVQISEHPLTTARGFARAFSLIPFGDRVIMIWSESDADPDDYELVVQTFSSELKALDKKQKITSLTEKALDPAASLGPSGTIGIIFNGTRGAIGQTFFTRLECVGLTFR